jgi:hypothetical protein
VFSWGWGVAAVFWIAYNIIGIGSVILQLGVGFLLFIFGAAFIQCCGQMIQRYGELHHNLPKDMKFPEMLLPLFLEKISTETTLEESQDQGTGVGPEESIRVTPNLGPFTK